MARDYKGYGFPPEDLVAQGNLGLMAAVKNFDATKGARFASYAVWWVRSSIQEYVMNNWSLVRLGRTGTNKRLFFTLRSTLKKVEQDINQGILPKDTNKFSKAAELLSVSLDEVLLMLEKMTCRDYSLNSPITDDGSRDAEVLDLIMDNNEDQEAILIDDFDMKRKRELLHAAIASLNEREQKIFNKRYLSEEPGTLDDISRALGISRERVRQIGNAAFIKIQKSMHRASAF
jgi:RNA polymerase sigma-32 factor